MRRHQIQSFLLRSLSIRTTLSLADDVALIARQVAARDHVSLDEAGSHLARDGYRAKTERPATQTQLKSCYSVLPMRDETITSERVRRLMDEEGM